MTKFSIIVPVYNVEDYIEKCLDSIIDQSYQNYEIICVNDGSTDLSGEIIKRYQDIYSEKIVVIEQDNAGLSAARNTGILNATGDYICFVDSDDMLAVKALEMLQCAVASHPDIEIVNYEMDSLVFEDGTVDLAKKEYYLVNHRYEGVRGGSDMLVDMITNKDYIESANLLLINRNWLMKSGIRFVVGALFEDSIFSIDCFLKCDRMLHLAIGIYVYRVRSNSIMTKRCTFNELKWRVWQFKEVLRRIYENQSNEMLQYALCKYAELVIGSIRNTYAQLKLEDKLNVGKLIGVDRLLLSMMEINETKSINSDLEVEGLIRKIENAKSILIYGAGYIGNKICHIIYELGMGEKIKKIVVYEESEGLNISGHNVEKIGASPLDDIDLAIIATVRDHKIIYETLKKYLNFDTVIIAISPEIDINMNTMMD